MTTGSWRFSSGPGADMTGKHVASSQRLTTTAPSDGSLGGELVPETQEQIAEELKKHTWRTTAQQLP